MRLRKMYLLTKKVYEDIKNIEFYKITPAGSTGGYFVCLKKEDFTVLFDDLDTIANFDWATEYLPQLFKFKEKGFTCSNEVRTRSDLVPMEVAEEALYNLKTAMRAVVLAFEEMGFGDVTQGFDIKMPPTDNFSEFAKNIDTIEKILVQCPMLKQNDAQLKLIKTDIGSIWYEFAVIGGGSLVLLTNLAVLINYGIKIASHIITLKQQQEIWKQQKVDSAICKKLASVYTEAANAVMDNALQEINDNVYEYADDDERNKTKQSLEWLSDLLTKGLEIHASLEATKEVKDLFPTDTISLLSIKNLLLLSDSSVNKDEGDD